jgi:predicted transposase YbfD/YdcC
MVAQCRPLIEVLGEIPDCRQARGKRHPLVALLALMVVATLCGFRSYSAIAHWARIYPRELVLALGFTHPITPCPATLCTVLKRLDRARVEAALGAWAQEVLAALPPAPDDDDAIALDGKTLRGSRQQGALQVHLLSALSHRLGMTVGQKAVDAKTNEIGVVVPLLHGLVLEGHIFTMDALLTQRAVAQTIVEGGGDYLVVVKGNQPDLLAQVELVFADPPEDDPQPLAQTVDRGHGRIEQRRLTLSRALHGYSTWPGLDLVFRLQRTVLHRKTGEIQAETVYGVSSLAPRHPIPDEHDAQRLLGLNRNHWCIENRSHWVRDVTFDEDRSQVRQGSTPEIMAAFRNLAIGLLRVHGETNIAAACRRFAAQPCAALALIGLPADN